jgi:hypothetical protein
MTIFNNKTNIYKYILIFCILVVLIFWLLTSSRPLFDMFAFRQCQTAMSALWFDLKNPIRGLFYYQTPEFGEPWMIPFEFPLYQHRIAPHSSRKNAEWDISAFVSLPATHNI